jgi:hypothetical protein
MSVIVRAVTIGRPGRWSCRDTIESQTGRFNRFTSFLKPDEELLKTVEHGGTKLARYSVVAGSSNHDSISA